MLFMQKIMNPQESSPRQLRKEPKVLKMPGITCTEPSMLLSESKLSEIEERKSKVQDFDQLAITDLSGFIGACLIDSETGALLAQAKCQEVTSKALAVEKVNSKIKAAKELGSGNTFEDVVITLDEQYHLIRRLKSAEEVFLYLVVDRGAANLGLVKYTLQSTEESIIL